MKYHLDIIDGNVELPEGLRGEYDDLNEAYHDLCDFVHSYDETPSHKGKDVWGEVVDEDGEKIDYCESIRLDFDDSDAYRYSVLMDGECADGFDDLNEAISRASYLFGKGYSDDIVIWDNDTDTEIEW